MGGFKLGMSQTEFIDSFKSAGGGVRLYKPDGVSVRRHNQHMHDNAGYASLRLRM